MIDKFEDMNYLELLKDILNQCKINNYIGWDKFDGTLSPYLKKYFKNNKYANFIFQQLVKESPFNLRPLLQIPKTLNIKGISLFILSYCNLYNISNNPIFLEEGIKLSNILEDLRSNQFSNHCWGHNFIWQTQDSKINIDQPNITNTCFAGFAFFNLYSITKDPKYKIILESIFNFICNDLYVQLETEDELAYSYFTISQKSIVNNIQGMIGSFLINYYSIAKDSIALTKYVKIFNYLLNSMNMNFTWNYLIGDGYDRIDNYHTAYVLDSILDFYLANGDNKVKNIYFKSVEVYEKIFFGIKGEPYWSIKFKYPYDIHSAANGIITFAKASIFDMKYLEKSKLILDWTINNMYREKDIDFIYRIFGPIIYNYSFMRWGNAWMCLAISEYLKYSNNQNNIN